VEVLADMSYVELQEACAEVSIDFRKMNAGQPASQGRNLMKQALIEQHATQNSGYAELMSWQGEKKTIAGLQDDQKTPPTPANLSAQEMDETKAAVLERPRARHYLDTNAAMLAVREAVIRDCIEAAVPVQGLEEPATPVGLEDAAAFTPAKLEAATPAKLASNFEAKMQQLKLRRALLESLELPLESARRSSQSPDSTGRLEELRLESAASEDLSPRAEAPNSAA
jgi:hypothetical protein